MSAPIHVTDDSFEQDVLQSELPVLVDFWGELCPPCKRLAPILDEIAAELDGQLKVAKVNVGENHIVASKFGIMGIPTLLVFKDGELTGERLVGFMPKERLVSKITPYL